MSMANCNAHAIIRTALATCLDVVGQKEEELGKLDAAAGDGDHGAGMMRGLRAATDTLETINDEIPPGMLLMQAGSAFSDAAGGASGALYGMFIMTVGKTLGGGPFETADIHKALEAGMAAIMKLGKSKPGDKTMLDALDPFITALSDSTEQPLTDAWTAALPAAEAGAKATADMVAAKGRSSKLGERSLGHPDPGATSMVYILKAVGQSISN